MSKLFVSKICDVIAAAIFIYTVRSLGVQLELISCGMVRVLPTPWVSQSIFIQFFLSQLVNCCGQSAFSIFEYFNGFFYVFDILSCPFLLGIGDSHISCKEEHDKAEGKNYQADDQKSFACHMLPAVTGGLVALLPRLAIKLGYIRNEAGWLSPHWSLWNIRMMIDNFIPYAIINSQMVVRILLVASIRRP